MNVGPNSSAFIGSPLAMEANAKAGKGVAGWFLA
jgi:hypothetical protein